MNAPTSKLHRQPDHAPREVIDGIAFDFDFVDWKAPRSWDRTRKRLRFKGWRAVCPGTFVSEIHEDRGVLRQRCAAIVASWDWGTRQQVLEHQAANAAGEAA